jgi:outer membrane protein assembly factor BamD (BamD/ComL family)
MSSISGLLSTNFFAQSIQSTKSQQFQQEFQQLGQDLQSGNLSAAQSDFSSLQSGTSSSQAPTNNPIVQAIDQLGQDLQSGNTTAAQKDVTQLQQDLNARQAPARHRHPHAQTDEASGSSNPSTSISTLFQQLGQDLQSSNISGAQQAYNSILQDFQGTSTGSAAASSSLSSGTLASAISLSA